MATLRQTFSDIASAIRAKGVSGTMKPIEMAQKIGEIQTGGGGTKYGVSAGGFLGDVDANGVYQSPTETFKFNGVGIKTINLSVSSFIRKFINNNVIVEFNTPDLETLSGNGSSTNGCFFQTCMNSSVVKASMPKLQSVSAYACYQMFDGCTSLTTAPELPATKLAYYCYAGMFRDCTSLTTAPELPATTLTDGCYRDMFRGCTSLTTAPELPATTLTGNCYRDMFNGCTSLTTATVLPATTFAGNCYAGMFRDCTSLTTAPYLPATTLDNNCYYQMFTGCKSLKRIKMNASSGNWGSDMFNGCKSLELVDMTGSTDVPQLQTVNNFANTNDTYKIVVPDSLYDTWINATNWASIASHIMKQTDWNAAHPDDILGQ